MDGKKVSVTLKKLGCQEISGIDDVTMYLDDSSLIRFKNPKVQALPSSNTYAISGQSESVTVKDLINEVLKSNGSALIGDDDEVPDLVGNFDAIE